MGTETLVEGLPAFFYTYIIATVTTSLILGILGVTSAIGVLVLKNWARKMLIGVASSIIIFNLIYVTVDSFTNPYQGTPSYVVGAGGFLIRAVYYGLLIAYFSSNKVKQEFIQKNPKT